MYLRGLGEDYSMTVTAPPPDPVPYMYAPIPTELEPPKTQWTFSPWWLLLPVVAQWVLFSKKR